MHYTAPFVSFAEPDSEGIRAQVKVETGLLPIKSIADAGKMKKVTFDISAIGNAKLKRDPYANVNPSEAAFLEAQRAFEAGEPVEFRIEAQRKASLRLPKRKPMSQLDAQSETARCLVGINATSTSEARTVPAEDRMWSETAAEEAPDFLDVNASRSGGTVAVDEAIARDVYARVVKSQGDGSQSAIAVAAVLAIFGVDVYIEA
jgi:hypothetical protein